VHGKSNFFSEVFEELELFIDKKVIFDEKKNSVGLPSTVCQQIDTSPFQVKVF
jgi:hypothetical protein